jgi:hypothetical protein
MFALTTAAVPQYAARLVSRIHLNRRNENRYRSTCQRRGVVVADDHHLKDLAFAHKFAFYFTFLLQRQIESGCNDIHANIAAG